MSEPIYISDDGDGYLELVTHVNNKRISVGLPNESVVEFAEELLLKKAKKAKAEMDMLEQKEIV